MNYSQSHAKAATNFYTDEELLPALKNRDENSVRHIYYQYWPIVLKLVKANKGDEEEAKDVFQESILDFLERLSSEKFVLTCKVRTYFYSIFRNKWFNHSRGRRALIDFDEYIIEEHPFEEAKVEEKELPDNEQIKNAVFALGEPCRSLLIGFYYEKLSMDQLAVKLKYKDSNVAKQQKFRCKDRLKLAVSKFFKFS